MDITPSDWAALGAGAAFLLSGAVTAWRAIRAERQAAAAAAAAAASNSIANAATARNEPKLDEAARVAERVERHLLPPEGARPNGPRVWQQIEQAQAAAVNAQTTAADTGRRVTRIEARLDEHAEEVLSRLSRQDLQLDDHGKTLSQIAAKVLNGT